MKAIQCEAYGPLEALQLRDCPDPVAAAGQAVVAIRACGVNYPDALLAQGLYQDRPPVPFVPGIEFAGDVIELSTQAEGVKVGERVLGFSPSYGAFAERIACPVTNLISLPAAMSYEEGANLVCAHGTAHHALKQRARIVSGETLLVLGAAGGTGLAAVQIGKAMGARVIAACSTDDKLELARHSGADELINYSQQELRAAIKSLTAGRGVDVVYDPVGGEAFDSAARCMARNGRLLVVGFASGTISNLPVNLTLVKEFAAIGVFWGSFVRHEPAVFAANMRELLDWYVNGKVHVVTSERYPLAAAGEALNALAARQATGKVVLIP